MASLYKCDQCEDAVEEVILVVKRRPSDQSEVCCILIVCEGCADMKVSDCKPITELGSDPIGTTFDHINRWFWATTGLSGGASFFSVNPPEEL